MTAGNDQRLHPDFPSEIRIAQSLSDLPEERGLRASTDAIRAAMTRALAQIAFALAPILDQPLGHFESAGRREGTGRAVRQATVSDGVRFASLPGGRASDS